MSKDRFSHKKAQNSQNLFEILCLFVANKPLRHQHDLSVGARFHHELMRARSLRKRQLMADVTLRITVGAVTVEVTGPQEYAEAKDL